MEGIDDPSFVAVGILDLMGNARQLVQQIGRATRYSNGDRRVRQTGWILAMPANAARIRAAWERYKGYKKAMHEAAFCPRCATALTARVPDLDTRVRKVCPRCSFVVYVNPKIAAGTVPVRDGKIALVRRGIEPSLGRWSWPCGCM